MMHGIVVVLGEDEHLDRALRKFRKAVGRSGIMRDWLRTRCYLKPSERRNQKRRQAVVNQRRRSKRR